MNEPGVEGSETGKREEAAKDIWTAFGVIRDLDRVTPPLVPVDRKIDLPLSFAQERVWSVLQTEPDSPVYNIPLCWYIHGTLDERVLEASISHLVQRHEILRTTFQKSDSGPVQVVSSAHRVILPIVDLRSVENPKRQALRLAHDEVQIPFRISEGPLSRATLYKLNKVEHLLLVTFHQLVFDGWSKSIFSRDLVSTYQSIESGSADPLPTLNIQYADFAHWHRSWWHGELVDRQRKFWTENFRSKYFLPELPIDRPRSTALTGTSSREPLVIPEPLARRIRKLSGEENATLFVTLLAGLQVLLYRYTGQEDIIVFSSFGNRFRKELRQLVGLFANFLPLRTDLRGNPSFRELLGRVRDLMLGVYANPLLPFEDIMKLLQSAIAGHHISPFQVMFILQSSPPMPVSFGGLTFTPTNEIENGKTKFDLLLEMDDTKSELKGELTYNGNLFDPLTARRLMDSYKELLEIVVADPDKRIRDFPSMVSAATKQGGFSSTEVQPEKAKLVPPRDPLETQLVNLWQSVLGVEPIGVKDNFFDLGGHSLLAVRLFERTEKLVGKSLPLVTLLQAPTIEQLANLLRRDGWSPHWSSLVPLQPIGSKPPFYCVHGYGGNILDFEHFVRYMGPDQPLYGIQAQGLDGRMPRHKSVEEMATHYVKEVREFQPQGPYYLGGSSFGGLVAFELARQLKAAGEEVALLVFFDTRAPGYPRYLPIMSTVLKRLNKLRYRIELHWSNLRMAQGTERVDYIREKTKEVKKRTKGIAMSKFRRMRGVLEYLLLPQAIRSVQKAGLQANSAYIPKPNDVKVTLFRAMEQPHGIYPDRTNGWDKLALGGVEVYDIPGHHGAIMFEPRVKVLARTLIGCLDRAQINVSRRKQEFDTK